MGHVDVVVVDKTGTLTERKAKLVSVVATGQVDEHGDGVHYSVRHPRFRADAAPEDRRQGRHDDDRGNEARGRSICEPLNRRANAPR